MKLGPKDLVQCERFNQRCNALREISKNGRRKISLAALIGNGVWYFHTLCLLMFDLADFQRA
jgi:hypothetical protein